MRRALSTRLGILPLEARDVPSVVAAYDLAGNVQVISNNTNSNVTLTRYTPAGLPTNWVHVQDTTNGFDQWVNSTLGLKRVSYYGGSGADTVDGSAVNVPMTLDGGAGNDVLTGGPCNDNLYGRAGFDTLHGAGGSDFIDPWYDASGNFITNGIYVGPLPQEVAGGDAGFDFFANQVVVNGTTATDVHQGSAPNCWMLAPLAGAADAGYDLASRISYRGNGVYRVKLLNPDGPAFYQDVSLEGGRLDFEPMDESNQQESWVILFNRAMAKQQGIDWTDADAFGGITMPSEVMKYLTGRNSSNAFAVSNFGWVHFGSGEMQAMADDLAQGKLVCAGTRPGDYGSNNFFGDVTTKKLVGDGGHVYSVLAVQFTGGVYGSLGTVTLYNPWGHDVASGGTASGPGNEESDGIVTVTFDQFYGSFEYIGVS